MSMIKEHPTNTFSWRFILLHYAIGYVLAVVAGVLLSIISAILGFPLGGVAYVVIILYGAAATLTSFAITLPNPIASSLIGSQRSSSL